MVASYASYASYASFHISPWLLSLIMLVVSSAIGVYYLNPKLYTFVPEGFFSIKVEQDKCKLNRDICIDVNGVNSTCITIYNDCTMKAADANITIYTTVAPAPSPPANPTLSGTSLQSSDVYNKLITSLSERTPSGRADTPTTSQLSLIQGDHTGYSDMKTGEYKPHQEIIKAHMTPTLLKSALLAKVASDNGTQAQTIQDASIVTPSVRDMIRTDVKKTIRDEITNINNEYEIKYE